MTSSRRGLVVLGVTAVALVAAILIIASTRPSSDGSAARASESPSATATASLPRSSSPASPSTSQSAAASGVRPDAAHGLIVSTGNMRTEDDPRGMQQPSLFMTAPTTVYSVSPEGKRIALITLPQTGQRIVTFTTARPNDVTTAVDLTGSGESAIRLVWAGDGSGSLLFVAVNEVRVPGATTASWTYSALRTVDLATRDVREIARITSPGQNAGFWPVAWLPSRQIAGAFEITPEGTSKTYALVRNGTVERTALTVTANTASLSASRDSQRILVPRDDALRWWPVDQPAAMKDLPAQAGEHLGRAEFRPGADEIGVEVAEGGRLEVWSLTGQRRVAATRVGNFQRWRADGSAALTAPDSNTVFLVDPSTGASTPLPGGGFPIAEVVLF